MPGLHDPISVGTIEAANRIFMAPLTRARATREHVPTPVMADYYSQRASAGLIISEATGISRQGLGWPYAPGIWSREQVLAWQPVTQAVHAAGGRIVAQLWHMGRVVHPDFLGGEAPVSASATTAPDHAHTYAGRQAYAPARALTLAEIDALRGDYVAAAANAIEAGFDGVQIHAANGYLIDQFLRDGSNHRQDQYGGPIANRIRLLVEVVGDVAARVGAGRVSVRLSPNEAKQGVADSDPEPLFVAAAAALSELGIGFLEVREPGPEGTFGKPDWPPIAPAMRTAFDGPFVLNSDYTAASAQAALDAGEADAISFGRPFIANPDLPARIAGGIAFASDDRATWYSQGIEGYLDYPAAGAAA
ncbi:MAG: alkene reductase [Erythrobacter sp.]|nr:alkene reductase [Erythrobacter sp.]